MYPSNILISIIVARAISDVQCLPASNTIWTTTNNNSTTITPSTKSVYLPSQSGIGPSYCSTGFSLQSTLSPSYGTVYPVSRHCDGKTWMPLGATSNGVPTVHAIYYSLYASPSAAQTFTIDLITAFIGGASTSNWFAPLKNYYDDCNHSPAVHFKGFRMGEFVSFYCGNNGSGNSKRCAAITQADETWVMSSLTHSGAIGLQNLDVYVFVVDPAIEEYAAGIYGKQQMGTTYCSYHATFQEKYSGKWLNYVVVQPNSNSNCMFNLKGIDTANGAELDTMMFNLAHEIVETVLAPNAADATVTALWQNSQKQEVMDICGCTGAGVLQNSEGRLYNTFFNNKFFILPSVFDMKQCVFNPN